MARVVGIHGVAQELKGPEVLVAEWEPALRAGVTQAGGYLAPGELACAFYGKFFRPPGEIRAGGEPSYRPADVTDDEGELLLALWEEAARAEPDRVASPDAELRAGTPRSVQWGLRTLLRSRFFAGLAERALIGVLKQVRRYFKEKDLRHDVRASIDDVVDTDTRVLLAHSLGSVVAYEALHKFGSTPRWANVKTLVTLGSPLGIPNLVFDALNPKPKGRQGVWPTQIERWTNISDDGDIVALTKKLGPLFGASMVDMRIVNGARVHDIMPYLTASETGKAVVDGLR